MLINALPITNKKELCSVKFLCKLYVILTIQYLDTYTICVVPRVQLMSCV